jgi:hypothetical protein
MPTTSTTRASRSFGIKRTCRRTVHFGMSRFYGARRDLRYPSDGLTRTVSERATTDAQHVEGAPGAVFLTQAGLSRRENVVAQTPGADIDCLVTVEKALGDDRFMGSKNLTR